MLARLDSFKRKRPGPNRSVFLCLGGFSSRSARQTASDV